MTKYFVGEYPIIVKVFPHRRGINFIKWLWASTNLFQRIRIGTFPLCRLGSCAVINSRYDGGDEWVEDMLNHGLCPICGNPTEEKYFRH